VLGELRSNVAGPDLRLHATLVDVLSVVGNPVDQCMAVQAKFFGSHSRIVELSSSFLRLRLTPTATRPKTMNSPMNMAMNTNV
jgi:hypothetical protein